MNKEKNFSNKSLTMNQIWQMDYFALQELNIRNLEKIGEDISKEPRITLSTIHQQKGGEADSVVVSLDIGKMAYKDFKKNPMSEHRLFYVAFSRARENLYILTPTSREAYRV